jgi:hypothetical protein
MLASAMELKHGTHFAAFAQEGDRLNFLFAYQPTFDPIVAKGNKFRAGSKTSGDTSTAFRLLIDAMIEPKWLRNRELPRSA